MISRLELGAATFCVVLSGWVLLGRGVPLVILLFVGIGLVLLPLLVSGDSYNNSSL